VSRAIRVALVGTADANAPGSMRAYAETLADALARHCPEIETLRVELDPHQATSGWRRRVAALALPWRARRLRGLKPDLWHVLDGSRAYLAEGLRGAPVLVTAHDIIPVLQQRGRFPGAPDVGAAARWLWRRNGAALRKAQGVICVSKSTQDDVVREFGTPIASRVVPLPVRTALATAVTQADAPSRESGVVLHVGNNSFYKNRAQVLRIFAALDRVLARRLVMAGAPPTRDLLGLAQELDIEASVEWVDGASDAQIARLYGSASVLVFPSLYEGFGWPVLEAMAFGLPVVCSNAGSLPEVVDGAAPCLAPDDRDGFVRETEALLRDPSLHAQRAQAGRVRAGEFSMERFAHGTVEAYHAALTVWPDTAQRAHSAIGSGTP